MLHIMTPDTLLDRLCRSTGWRGSACSTGDRQADRVRYVGNHFERADGKSASAKLVGVAARPSETESWSRDQSQRIAGSAGTDSPPSRLQRGCAHTRKQPREAWHVIDGKIQLIGAIDLRTGVRCRHAATPRFWGDASAAFGGEFCVGGRVVNIRAARLLLIRAAPCLICLQLRQLLEQAVKLGPHLPCFRSIARQV